MSSARSPNGTEVPSIRQQPTFPAQDGTDRIRQQCFHDSDSCDGEPLNTGCTSHLTGDDRNPVRSPRHLHAPAWARFDAGLKQRIGRVPFPDYCMLLLGSWCEFRVWSARGTYPHLHNCVPDSRAGLNRWGALAVGASEAMILMAMESLFLRRIPTRPFPSGPYDAASAKYSNALYFVDLGNRCIIS